MSDPLVVVDADVLGRERTGDETYVEQLLRALPDHARGLRLAAVTRDPSLLPPGIEPLTLPARSQELRMAWTLPRLLRHVRPALAHFVHALPPGLPCPAVLTVQDLSFERDRSVMSRRDRLVFRAVVPRSARRAARILAISERTKRDVVALYGIAPERVAVTLLGADPVFRPSGDGRHCGFLLFVGAVQERKRPLLALAAAHALGRTLVVVGPEKEPQLARELERRGADLRGYVSKDELARLYREAACVVLPSRYEGFGLPLVEAMASGTPVVASPDPAMQEVGGDAVVFADDLAAGVERALAQRARFVAAGIERARRFSWSETARLTADAYREVLG